MLLKFVSSIAVYAICASVTLANDILNDETVPPPLSSFQECDVCPEMVVLPEGEFVMGAPLAQSEYLYLLFNKPKAGVTPGWAHEGPEHTVKIDIPIAIGRNEVTREEWLACVAERGCSHTPDPSFPVRIGYFVADDPRHPVMNVSYDDMLEYVDWLNQKLGLENYRLPTEAEWEYAARAGTNTKFAQGDTLTLDQANIGEFENKNGRQYSNPRNRHGPVFVDEMDAVNGWGLRHMAGNVMEFTMTCGSVRHPGLPSSSAYLSLALETQNCHRIFKGGSFGAHADYARPANRKSSRQTRRNRRAGFRLVREM
ncbi:MAG: formylglycine-generating enzyme family protein [Paracoccaceae bacterium]